MHRISAFPPSPPNSKQANRPWWTEISQLTTKENNFERLQAPLKNPQQQRRKKKKRKENVATHLKGLQRIPGKIHILEMPELSSHSMDKIKSEWITELNIRSDAVDVCLGDEFGVHCEESRQQRQSGARLHENNKITQ